MHYFSPGLLFSKHPKRKGFMLILTDFVHMRYAAHAATLCSVLPSVFPAISFIFVCVVVYLSLPSSFAPFSPALHLSGFYCVRAQIRPLTNRINSALTVLLCLHACASERKAVRCRMFKPVATHQHCMSYTDTLLSLFMGTVVISDDLCMPVCSSGSR